MISQGKYKVFILVFLLLILNIQFVNGGNSIVKSPGCSLSNFSSDIPWPMLCHDPRHSGRSPYDIEQNPGLVKWKVKTDTHVTGSAVVDSKGMIYFGDWLGNFYALYPNGTIYWKQQIEGIADSCPAIDSQGRIYIADTPWTATGETSYIYSFYPNSTLRWKIEANIESSLTIGTDDTIYFGDTNGNLNAVSSDGKLLWSIKLSDEYHNVMSSTPAVGNDGTIYCGTVDGYLHALNPNGTIKWSFTTEGDNWIRSGISVADDGTIYCCSDKLYAIHPNGTAKWNADLYTITTPVFEKDGTIYIGNENLIAINHEDGSVKWSFDPKGKIHALFGTCEPSISNDGYIVFGTDNGWIYALNKDGDLLWENQLTANEGDIVRIYFSPVIGKDGTIYVGAYVDEKITPGTYRSAGYLYAIGTGLYEAEAHGPYVSLVNVSIDFQGSARNGSAPYEYYWDFGDGAISFEQNPSHYYSKAGNYEIRLRVKDKEGNIQTDYTNATIYQQNTPPDTPRIYGPIYGSIGMNHIYSAVSFDREKHPIQYVFDWGDGNISQWIGPYDSGRTVQANHMWNTMGDYEIKVKAKDEHDAESNWATLEVSMPKNNILSGPLYKFFQNHPRLFPLFRHWLGLQR